jgi:hypothetical protein
MAGLVAITNYNLQRIDNSSFYFYHWKKYYHSIVNFVKYIIYYGPIKFSVWII